MQLFSADESGLIKVIDYENSTLIKKYREQKLNNAPIGMSYVDDHTIAVSVIDGHIEFVDSITGAVRSSLKVKEYISETSNAEYDLYKNHQFETITHETKPPLSLNKRIFVSSHVTKDNIAIIDRMGHFFYFHNIDFGGANNSATMELMYFNITITQPEEVCKDDGVHSIKFKTENNIFNHTNPGKHVEVMKVCPDAPNIFAVSGRNTNVRIFDIALGSNKAPIHESENLPNDRLDIEIPIWDKDLVFVPNSFGKRLFTCTNFGDIRYYDFSISNKPLFSQRINFNVDKDVVTLKHFDLPLTKIAISGDRLIVGANTGKLFSVDIEELYRSIDRNKPENAAPERINNCFDDEDTTTVYEIKLAATYFLKTTTFKGFANGSIKDIIVHPTLPLIAVSSIDRFVRIFNITTGALLNKIYLKQRLMCLLFRTDEDAQNDPDTKKEDNEDCTAHAELAAIKTKQDTEEFWRSLDTTKDAPLSIKKKKLSSE